MGTFCALVVAGDIAAQTGIPMEVASVGPAWIAAIAAVIVAVPVAAKIWQQLWTSSSPWKRQKRRETAWMRMAERFASESSQGYPITTADTWSTSSVAVYGRKGGERTAGRRHAYQTFSSKA